MPASPLPSIFAAMLEAIAKSRSASASSMATIAKTVLVKGPLVLYSLRTSVVAAGAVAEPIAPKSNPSAHETVQSPRRNPPRTPIRQETTKNAPTPSNSNIFRNCFPYLVKISFFNSPPIIKPIRPKAK